MRNNLVPAAQAQVSQLTQSWKHFCFPLVHNGKLRDPREEKIKNSHIPYLICFPPLQKVPKNKLMVWLVHTAMKPRIIDFWMAGVPPVLKATWTLCGPCCVTFTKPQYCLRGTYIHITPGEEAKQMRGSELFPLSVNKSPYSQSYID